MESYTDEVIGLCIVCMGTFVRREPAVAAPQMLEMLKVVARVAAANVYAWKTDSNIIIPGNSQVRRWTATSSYQATVR